MENKKKIKISIGSFIFLILIVIIITAGAFLGFSYYLSNNTDKVQNNNGDKVENNLDTEINNSIEQDIVQINKKIDNEKEWIYKAKYENNLEILSYTALGDEIYKITDIQVPYININSVDATKANNEIKELYEELVEEFEINAKAEETMAYIKSSYNTYSNDNILSLVIEVEKGETYLPIYQYYTYNFDLTTLELCSYKEILNISGKEENVVEAKLEKAIKQIEEVKALDNNTIDEIVDIGIYNYNEDIKDNTIKYYLDSNNNLNIILKIEISDIDPSEFIKILTIQ